MPPPSPDSDDSAKHLRVTTGSLDLSRPLIVGILNATPDSFSDGGELCTLDSVLMRAEMMLRDGADILDIGGESTRPGASPVSEIEELRRVLPAVSAVTDRFKVPVSIDTRRATVADECLQAGASLVNDVSGFGDKKMGAVIAAHGAGWVLMHMPHSVGAMAWSTRSVAMTDGVFEGLERVALDLKAVVDRALIAGVSRDQLAVDPGIGFGKSQQQNLGFLRHLGPVAKLGLPILVGPSRKSFIGKVTGKPPRERLFGTAAAVTAAVLAGANLLRVHDVAAMREVVDVAAAIAHAGSDMKR